MRWILNVVVWGMVIFLPELVWADSLQLEAEPSSVVLPELPGSIGGVQEEFSSGGSRGSVTLGLSLPLPASTGGPEPVASIRYSSERGQGILGTGWSMEQGRLCRRTDAGAPSYDAAVGELELLDLGSASGELVAVDDYLALRWETESVRVDRRGEGWALSRVDGSVWLFGTTAEGRRGPDTGTAEGTACWYVEHVEDVAGRRMDVRYRDAPANGHALVDEVRYAYGARGGFRVLRYGWEDRPDSIADFRFGFPRRLTERVAGIFVEWEATDGSRERLRTARFSYSTGVSGTQLDAMTMIGEGGETLPVQSFGYGELDLRYAVDEVAGAPTSVDPTAASLTDVDGDGLSDVLQRAGTAWQWRRNLGATDGALMFASPTEVGGLDSLNGERWRMVDVDGDGLRDVVSFESAESVWYRNGTGPDHVPVFERAGELGLRSDDGFGAQSTRFVDINGDGVVDAVSTAGGRLLIAQGSVPRDASGGLMASAALGFSQPRLPVTGSGVEGWDDVDLGQLQFCDMNGDSLQDVARISGTDGSWSVLVHPGDGSGVFGASEPLDVPASVVSATSPEQVQFIDVSGDGRCDLVTVVGVLVAFHVRAVDGSWTRTELPIPSGVSALARPVLADVSGDSRPDALFTGSDGGWSAATSMGEGEQALMTWHDNGMGQRRWFDWVSSAELGEAGGEMRQHRPLLVSQRQSIAGSPDMNTAWTYAAGRWDARFGSFAGFEWVSQTVIGDKETGAPDQHVILQYYAGIAGESSGLGGVVGRPDETLQHDDLRGLRGMVRLRRTLDDEGGLIQESRNAHVIAAWGAQYRARQAESVVIQAEGLVAALPAGERGDPRAAVEMREPLWGDEVRFGHEVWSWDALGQMIRHHQRGVVSSDGSEVAGDEECTESDYAVHADSWRRSGVAELRRLDGTCTEIIERRRRYYDGAAYIGLPLGQSERGYLQRESVYFAEEDRWIDERIYSRNEQGSVLDVIDALGHHREFEYGPTFGVFPTVEFLHLNEGAYGRSTAEALRATAIWDEARGTLTEHVDFAGVATAIDYDGLNRETFRIEAIRTPSARTMSVEYGFDDTGGQITFERDVLENGGRVERSVNVLDGAGRSLANLTVGETGTRVEGRVRYGPTGSVLERWDTYVVADSQAWAEPPLAASSNTYTYDSLGRLVTHQTPGGFTTRSRYGVGVIETTDDADRTENSLWRDTPDVEFQDAFGRMTRVRRTLIDPGPQTPRYVDTAFSYDALNRRTEAVRDHGARRVWRYDSLGRIAEYQDSQTGLTTWTYDDAGSLTSRVNGASDTVAYEYDAAGRVIRVSGVDSGSETVQTYGTFEYDVSPTGAAFAGGRMVASNEGGIRTEIDWAPSGQPWRRRRIIDDRIWEISYQYDILNRLRRTRYPGGVDVEHTYDDLGQLRSVSGAVDDIEYDERSLPRAYRLNDVLALRRDWDEQRRRTGMVLTVGARQLMDVGRTFGDDNTVASIDDRGEGNSAFSQSLQVTPDAWGRTVSVASPAFGNVSWNLDGVDRLHERQHDPNTGVGARDLPSLELRNMRYADPASDLLVEADGRAWSYDEQGRMVSSRAGEDERTMSWDGLEHLRNLALDAGTHLEFDWAVNFALLRRSVYDADGELLEQRLHLDDSCEQITDARGSWLRIRYRVHGEDLARRELLRVDGDWADTGTQPLPLVPLVDADPTAMARSFNGAGQLSGSGWSVVSILVHGASDLPVPAAVVVVLSLRLLTHRRFRFLVVQFVRGGDGEIGRAFGAHSPPPRATAWRFTVVAGVASTMLFAPLISCVDTVGGETENPGDGSGDEGSGGDISVPVDRDDMYYMFAPWLGTVVMQTDDAGNVVGRSLVSPDGALVRRQFDSTGLYYERFANAERCEFSGLVNFGARFYDPSAARWLNADPLAMLDQLSTAEMNGYSYVGWRLLRLLDALGLSGVDDDSAVLGRVLSTVSAGFSGHSLMDLADNVGAGSGLARGISGAVGGVITAGSTANTLVNQGASTGEVIVGSLAGGAAGTVLNFAAASNPITGTLMVADSFVGAVDPNLAVTPAITSGYTAVGLTATGLIQGDLSAANNYVDDMRTGGAGYIGQGAVAVGDALADGAHRAVMSGRHAAVSIESARSSATESVSGFIGAVDGALGSPAARFAEWLDR